MYKIYSLIFKETQLIDHHVDILTYALTRPRVVDVSTAADEISTRAP